nr:hypothetical protein [Tanacetum cinerariifolium]
MKIVNGLVANFIMERISKKCHRCKDDVLYGICASGETNSDLKMIRMSERDMREISEDRGGEWNIQFLKNRLKESDNEARDKQIILRALANIDFGVVEQGIGVVEKGTKKI